MTEIAKGIAAASDEAVVLRRFAEAVRALGAERGFFASFDRRPATSECSLMLNCDPRWSLSYLDARSFTEDPWLGYASTSCEPAEASAIRVTTPAQREVVESARRAGFTSVALFPAHGGGGRTHASVMCLGHSVAGFFDDAGFATLRVCARVVAMELHDWRTRQMRDRLLRHARLSPTELRLLEHEYRGHGTKQIAAEFRVSGSSINSRFQRLNARLRVPNRRMAAKLAVECGLISG